MSKFIVLLFTSLVLCGCPLGEQGPQGPEGPEGPAGEPGRDGHLVVKNAVDFDDQLDVWSQDIVGDQDNPLGIRRVHCPDSHPILLNGGCDVAFGVGISRSVRVAATEEENAGWECVPAIPSDPSVFIILATATATCVHE